MNLSKYKPIKIFHDHFSYGWWFGSYFFFLRKNRFAIVPMWYLCAVTTYANGKLIGHGTKYSWCEDRQHEVGNKIYLTPKGSSNLCKFLTDALRRLLFLLYAFFGFLIALAIFGVTAIVILFPSALVWVCSGKLYYVVVLNKIIEGYYWLGDKIDPDCNW